MLIGGDDISNDIITLGMCLQYLFTVLLISALRLLAKSDSSVDGELGAEFKLQRHSCKLSFLPSLLATVTMQLKLG